MADREAADHEVVPGAGDREAAEEEAQLLEMEAQVKKMEAAKRKAKLEAMQAKIAELDGSAPREDRAAAQRGRGAGGARVKAQRRATMLLKKHRGGHARSDAPREECSICGNLGHSEERCWFRSGEKHKERAPFNRESLAEVETRKNPEMQHKKQREAENKELKSYTEKLSAVNQFLVSDDLDDHVKDELKAVLNVLALGFVSFMKETDDEE